MTDPLLCYLVVTDSQNASVGTYQIPQSKGSTLAKQSNFFNHMIKQHGLLGSGKSSQIPTVQMPLPAPNHFDPLLHWLYHHDPYILTKSLKADSPNAFFGIVRNASQLAVTTASGLWDALAAYVAEEWITSISNHPKWTWTIIPVELAARSAIAIGGGGVGGDMMAKWASGDPKIAEKGVEEVRKVLELYRAQEDDDMLIEEYVNDYDVKAEKKKKKKGLLRRFADLMVKDEKRLVATVVVVRDANGKGHFCIPFMFSLAFSLLSHLQ